MKKLLLVLVLSLFLVGCKGLTPTAEKVLRDGISVNKGHMNDKKLPQEARLIAQDNHDLGWALLFHQGVEETLPEDVRARKDARDKAKGGGK